MSTGMKMSFGKSIGLAAQLKENQTILEFHVMKKDIEVAKKAADRAKHKFSCPTQTLVVEKA
jgi:ribosomal protein L16/L10AE